VDENGHDRDKIQDGLTHLATIPTATKARAGKVTRKEFD
jgi:hypothetical protein